MSLYRMYLIAGKRLLVQYKGSELRDHESVYKNNILITSIPRQHEHRLQMMKMAQDGCKSIVGITDISYMLWLMLHTWLTSS